MYKSIQKAIDKLEKAKAALRDVLAIEQHACSHDKVVQMAWKSSNWGAAHKGRRICTACGLEEQGDIGNAEYQYKYLKTGGWHKEVSDQEFYKYRLPEVPADAKERRLVPPAPPSRACCSADEQSSST